MQTLMVARSPMLNQCPVHAHDNWEMILNLTGSGREMVGGEWRPFGPGSITLCPPGVLHNKYIAPQQQWQDIYLRFMDPMQDFPLQPIYLTDDAAHTIAQVVELILQLFHQQGADAPVIQQLSDVLGTLLMDRIHPQGRLSTVTEAINHAIVQHYADADFDLAEVLTHQNYADGHIRRLYRREMHKTPHQHLMQLRLEHAKRLLRMRSTPRYSIQEVALLSGFDDANYFTRAFRQNTGVSPTQYRKTDEETAE